VIECTNNRYQFLVSVHCACTNSTNWVDISN